MSEYWENVAGSSSLANDPYDDPRPIAKARIQSPAIGLLIIGIFAVLAAIYASLDAGRVRGQLDVISRRMQKTEGITPEVKKKYAEWIKQYDRAMPALNGLSAVLGALVAIGGYQMLMLSSRGYCLFACILSMIPFATNFCCCLGLVFGIWGFFMLLMPDVKDGFARQAYSGQRNPPQP
jgi:hypothetical protein